MMKFGALSFFVVLGVAAFFARPVDNGTAWGIPISPTKH